MRESVPSAGSLRAASNGAVHFFAQNRPLAMQRFRGPAETRPLSRRVAPRCEAGWRRSQPPAATAHPALLRSRPATPRCRRYTRLRDQQAATYASSPGTMASSRTRVRNDATMAVRSRASTAPTSDVAAVVRRTTETSGRMTLVKRLVELHGGHVTARSAGRGTGSEFAVWLPVAMSGPNTHAPIKGARQQAVGAARVLVVDDYKDVAVSTCRILSLLGYETCMATDPQIALQLAAEFQPEVALLDIGMPKLNGYELARRIRGLPGGSETVLIAVTGWGQTHDRQLCSEAGFNHHLVKPVDPAALAQLLDSMIGERRKAGATEVARGVVTPSSSTRLSAGPEGGAPRA